MACIAWVWGWGRTSGSRTVFGRNLKGRTYVVLFSCSRSSPLMRGSWPCTTTWNSSSVTVWYWWNTPGWRCTVLRALGHQPNQPVRSCHRRPAWHAALWARWTWCHQRSLGSCTLVYSPQALKLFGFPQTGRPPWGLLIRYSWPPLGNPCYLPGTAWRTSRGRSWGGTWFVRKPLIVVLSGGGSRRGRILWAGGVARRCRGCWRGWGWWGEGGAWGGLCVWWGGWGLLGLRLVVWLVYDMKSIFIVLSIY